MALDLEMLRESTVKKSAREIDGVTAVRFPDFKKDTMTGRLLVGDQLCCVAISGAALAVHIPDPSWIGTPTNMVRPWIVIGTFSVDGEKRSMRPRLPSDIPLLKLIATAAIELSKTVEK